MLVVLLTLFTLAFCDFPPKTFVVDVDGTAEERWSEACKVYGPIAKEVLPIVLDLIPPALQPYYEEEAMYYYNNHIPDKPYKEDIDYLASCIGVDIKTAITVNLVYDFSAWCTSIIAKDSNGRIYHGRNQDYPPPLRNDTIDVVFVSSKNNNKTIFTATTFFGYVGIPTGVKPEVFSVTIDARFLGSRYIDNLESIHAGYFPSGWLVRDVLMNATTFDEAYNMFANVPIMAPIYYIMGGTDNSNNGAVLTRNETTVDRPLMLSSSPYDWFIIETNYEWWHRAPFFDDRRDAAIANLESIGQENINFDGLFYVLSQPPVLNDETCYTILMAASQPNYYNCTVRTYEGGVDLPFRRYQQENSNENDVQNAVKILEQK